MAKERGLGWKIGGGFGVVLLLLAISAFVAWRGFDDTADGFVDYRRLAGNSDLASRLQEEMLTVRMNVSGFIVSGDIKAVEEYDRHLEMMKGFLLEADQQTVKPERKEIIAGIGEHIAAYDMAFRHIISLTGERKKLVEEVLNVVGPKMEQNLLAILDSANLNNDLSTAYETGKAIRHLLLGQQYAQKFLDSNLQVDQERVEQEFSLFVEETVILRMTLGDQKLIDLNDQTASQVQQYKTAFLLLAKNIYARNDIIEKTLDSIGPQLGARVEEIKRSLGEEQNELGSRVETKSRKTEFFVVSVALAAIGIGLSAAFFITRSITAPIGRVVDYVSVLAQGDFTATLDVRQHDEVGSMARELRETVGHLGSLIKEVVEGVTTLKSASTSLFGVSTELSSTADEASHGCGVVASAAEEMSANMQSVSAAMEQSAANVGMVAAAAEQMSATVHEIARNTAKAKEISQDAVEQAARTSGKINELGQAADRIGRVTETITDISEQTNLLALNATIEAARAGEAGKGFAVVANEIKELARQTAGATVDIKNQIEEMQRTAGGTISDIEVIAKVIKDINEVITSIASAVEQQSSATSEIAENITQASSGIGEVNENVAQSSVVIIDITKDIGEITNKSQEMQKTSLSVEESAASLLKLSDQLDGLVSHFTTNDS